MSERVDHGRCRCGRVSFAARGAPLVTMACHCRGCQLMTGSAYSVSSLYRSGCFSVEGDPVRGGLGTGPTHMFCASCMSWLYTTPEGMDEFVNVRSTLFDEAADHRPFVEMRAAQALGWGTTGAVKSYETEPGEAEFGELIAAYGEWDGRVNP